MKSGVSINMKIMFFLAGLILVPKENHGLQLGDVFPHFEADTTTGKIKFHDWLGYNWAILFSYPGDFLPVPTTELATASNLHPEFVKRIVKLIALSCDNIESHNIWIEDIIAISEHSQFSIPIITDGNRDLAVTLGMLDPDEKDLEELPLSCRTVFIIGPDKKLKLSMLYPVTTGINFEEISRVIQSLQLTALRKVATPVNWKGHGECMVLPSVKPEEANKLFPKGVKVVDVPSNKHYLRLTHDP